MSVSRRSFAESLAVAALAPLIGARPETIRLGGWSPTAFPDAGEDQVPSPVLLAIGIRYQERTGFHRMRPPGL